MFHVLLQELTADRIQLPIQQVRTAVQQGDRHTALREAIGGLQAEKAAADHHCAAVAPGGFDQGPGIVQITERHDARKILARHSRFCRP